MNFARSNIPSFKFQVAKIKIFVCGKNSIPSAEDLNLCNCCNEVFLKIFRANL